MKKYEKKRLLYFIITLILLLLIVVFARLSDNLKEKKCLKKRDSSVYVPPETSVVDKQFNFHIIAPGVWRSAQVSEESIRRMKIHGLKTIINFRGNEKSHQWEKKMALKLGIKYYQFSINSKKRQSKEKLAQILEIMNNPKNQPVLIHCLGGKDRAGLLSALYKIQFMNASKNDIHKEMLMFGYSQKEYPYISETVRSWDKNNIKDE